jgi:predicted phage tail protein
MSSDEHTKWPMPMFNPADFTKLGKEQADALNDMQKEFAKLIEQANADWLARMEQERELASDLAAKLAAAKSLPDAAKAYQDWMGRRMETITKDSQKFFADSQKLVTSMNRFMSTGGKGSST